MVLFLNVNVTQYFTPVVGETKFQLTCYTTVSAGAKKNDGVIHNNKHGML